MKHDVSVNMRQRGTVLLVVVFATALMAVLISGMLQINIDDVQITQNQIGAAQALAVAEAGLNDAMVELREDSSWQTGFAAKSFPGGGTYTVVLEDLTVTSTGTSADGYTAVVMAELSVSDGQAPHSVSIESLRINE